jgi:hypothetical protein
MRQPLTGQQLWITAGLASLLLGTIWVAAACKTQAQDQAAREQATAREIAIKMTEAQRSYYQKKGKFNVVVQELAKDLNLTLPSSFNYAVRTSFEAAYIYVLPARTPLADQLKAYVGGAFIKSAQSQDREPEIVTIICESTKTGRLRPAAPQVVRGKDSSPTTELSLKCGDFSVPVPHSNQQSNLQEPD